MNSVDWAIAFANSAGVTRRGNEPKNASGLANPGNYVPRQNACPYTAVQLAQ